MALDGLVVHSIVHELQSLVGGRIGKIHQPSSNDILLQIRSHSGGSKLLLSANPTYPRVHLTQSSFQNPTEAPMFCMLMRKHCEGGVIEALEQVDNERIIKISVRQRDELGDISSKAILVEIMGRHSNIILLDPKTGVILDGIHHVTPAISSYRIVLPGSQYSTPPDQGKENPLAVGRETFLQAFEAAAAPSAPREQADGESDMLPLNASETSSASTSAASTAPIAAAKPDKAIVAAFSGISPLVAREIAFRASQVTDPSRQHADLENKQPDPESLWLAFSNVMESIRSCKVFPSIVQDRKTGKLFFSVIELTHLDGDTQHYETVSRCLEAFYGDKAERDTVKQRTADLHRFLQNERNKNVKKLEKLKETIEEAKDADKYRILGELLTASLHMAKKGDKQVEVINYYDEEQKPVVIELDPLLTPSENSQRLFKKYTKTKNSLAYMMEQIEHTEQEIRYLETLLQQLDSAGISDIEEIREELVEQKYLRDRGRKTGKKKKKDKPALTCYTSSEGISIYVGKNNLQNEYLTNRLAQSSDTWLHTKDIPGSHVVIRSSDFSEDTLHEAAQLSAYFSQAKESSRVPVDYTLIRHVRKPNGSKPGFVIYDRQKTLFVTPDEQKIKQMKSTQA